jgi:hypothetical protein
MELDLQDLARRGLRAELARLDLERARIAGLLEQLEGTSSSHSAKTASASSGRKRRMSPEGRLRIQEAVRRRWASAGELPAAAEPSAGTVAPEAQPARRGRGATKRAGGRKK